MNLVRDTLKARATALATRATTGLIAPALYPLTAPARGVWAQSRLDAFLANEQALIALANARNADYLAAQPFPHTVIDRLFPDDVLDALIAEYPDPNSTAWKRYAAPMERKLEAQGRAIFGPVARSLVSAMSSETMLRFLETLTGIRGLLPDPWLHGAGFHQIERGGYLKIHADFNVHYHHHLHRRLNVLLYLNRDWLPEYGGHLELWNATMSRCEQRIAPLFNRLAIFSTSSTSFHGHPDPLTCPVGRARRSFALYYYTREPAPEAQAPHGTVWKLREGDPTP